MATQTKQQQQQQQTPPPFDWAQDAADQKRTEEELRRQAAEDTQFEAETEARAQQRILDEVVAESRAAEARQQAEEREQHQIELADYKAKEEIELEKDKRVKRGKEVDEAVKQSFKDAHSVLTTAATLGGKFKVNKGMMKLYEAENVASAGRAGAGKDLKEMGLPPTDLVKQTQKLSSSHMQELVPASRDLRAVNRPSEGAIRSASVTPKPKMRDPYSAYDKDIPKVGSVAMGLKSLKQTQQPQMGALRQSTMITSMGKSRIAGMAMPKTGNQQGLSMRPEALTGRSPIQSLSKSSLGFGQSQLGPRESGSPIQNLARGTFGMTMTDEVEPQQQRQAGGISMPKPQMLKLRQTVPQQKTQPTQSKLPHNTTLGLKSVKKFNPSYYNKSLRKYKKEVR